KLDPVTFPLADHVVSGTKVLPAVAYLEIARAAGALAKSSSVTAMRNIVWMRPMTANGVPVQVHTTFAGDESGTKFRIWSGDAAQPVLHARGDMIVDATPQAAPAVIDLDAVRRRCDAEFDGAQLYARTSSLALDLGDGFRSVRNVRIGKGEVLATLRLPQCVNGTRGAALVLHPSLLDGALQSLICFLPQQEQRLHVPFALEEVNIYGPTPETCFVHAQARGADGFDVAIADEAGQVRVALRNLSARPFASTRTDVLYAQPVTTFAPAPQGGEVLTGDFASVFERLRALALDPPAESRELVYRHDGDPRSIAIAALGATAMREIPRLRFRTTSTTRWNRYEPRSSALQLRGDGVYLVTGGTGRIGKIVADFLHTNGAKHIAACRRDADLGDRAQTFALVARLREQYGAIRGVIHAAGMTSDKMIANKTLDEARAVIAAKADAAFHLDEATRNEPLEFFILFSSIAALHGNAGQSDYAYANAVLDAFAEQREGPGRTCSINWPPWKDGGLAARDAALRNTGFVPMETEVGLEALAHAMTDAPRRFLVAQGNVAQIEQSLQQPVSRPVIDGDVLPVVRELAAGALKLAPERIDPDRSLADYGMDSITFVELTDAINARFRLDLSPATLFEHRTLRALAGHLHGRGVAVAVAPKLIPIVRDEADVDDDAIAIVGMAGVMPGSRDLDEFWRHLREGRDLITEIPADRWDWRRVEGSTSRWGGFMSDVDKFDAAFFGISPREAALMDPQHRLFLEVAWHAIENAGWSPTALAGTSTGVFVGVGHSDYALVVRGHGVETEAHSATGMSNAMLANRVSFLLDLHGPSEPIDTACSSSLVALHRAAESIRRGECDMAIAGGVHVMLTPEPYVAFSKAGMLSPDGRCRTFDESANGYVRGEGAGAVFLKRLGRARADRDPVIAILRGSFVNHGGRATSLTAPNPAAQADLITRALRVARVSPSTIGYVEAHGTGTKLGDPIEVEGLKGAFGDAAGPCGLGSVKTNVGHLETAAGIAGVLKVLLAMQHRELPPNANFERLNPFVKLEGGPFHVVERVEPWVPLLDETGRAVRRAGVSSFGFGGANAHVVLEAVDTPASVDDGSARLIVLSAKDESRLQESVAALIAHLENHPELALDDVAYTLMFGRDELPCRMALLARTREELIAALRKGEAWRGETRDLAFLLDDEDGSELVARWTAKGKLESIARLWLAGSAVDWSLLPQCANARRVALPGT
ncbi:MAG TPA: beta-ketoacyl synthase N-terminal-like domain-containing protein, partial [Thermoanaerobaculia bacterium]|nr:beta-ketoacyl synthase N-terminal-like domain-containing protein [Thermoanaerobaculia bacterium]